MPKSPSFPKRLLVVPALLLAAAASLYSGLFLANNRRPISVELGFDEQYVEGQRFDLVRSVQPGSPAEKAGLQPGDRIVEINGRPLQDASSQGDVWARSRPGDRVQLTLKRPNVSAPIVTTGTFRALPLPPLERGVLWQVNEEAVNALFSVFLALGLAVLFLRLDDPNAWFLALMFAGCIGVPWPQSAFVGMNPSLRPFAMAYRAVFNGLIGALFYLFFAVFPAPSPLDRRAPWLKWVGLALGVAVAVPGLGAGHPRAPAVVARLAGDKAAGLLVLSYNYFFLALGLISLTWNALSATTPEARRKIRVILWGTLVGVGPMVLRDAVVDFWGLRTRFTVVDLVLLLLLFVFPLSFAYAVVKHRVLEIPVLLRRSARYLLVQRGFLILLAALSVGVTLVFALWLARYLEPLTRAAVPGGIALGTAFGTLLLWTGTRVHKGVGGRIDRAFFRNAYDARMILEDLAEKTRTATDRQELAVLLERHLNRALQPSFFAVYLETSDHQLSAVRGDVPSELETIPATQPMLVDLARRGRPWDVSGESLSPEPRSSLLAPLRPDCLVPMLGRDSRLAGLLLLGSRLSEEPYSSEDKHLLASVASQAGVALESIRLGEKIAERIEAERRAAQEMEFARQVQARLFPQKLPALQTLEYTGACIPARQVGGDYYDFLELRSGRLALVLADIAGKGVSGALLMANLQANLRSQYAMALDDLPRLLGSVNHLFYENTSDNSYATLFFADYDDSTGRLRYANCGHLPPLLLRAGERFRDRGSSPPVLERLEPTCTVLGLFDQWECSVRETQLAPGDALVLYTDGVTEAASAQGEEFGEPRLVEILRAQHHLPVPSLLEAVVAAVQKFSDGEQADDITLVVARCKFPGRW